MKKQNILLITLGILIILGGIWFFSGDDGEDANDVSVEDNKEDIEDNSDDEEIEDSEDSEESEDTKESESDIVAGALAPDFTLKDLDGEDVSLSDYRGKLVILNFWATWCGFCDKEMPDLDKINSEFDDVVVLAVDAMEDRDTVAKYIEEGGYDFDVVLDSEGEISKLYLVSAFPTSYFIEEDGTLIGRVAGMLEYDDIVSVIEKIKEER